MNTMHTRSATDPGTVRPYLVRLVTTAAADSTRVDVHDRYRYRYR
eukprot:SAG11_NODE_10750_length_809_cov_0.834979_2_plen_44_part_01